MLEQPRKAARAAPSVLWVESAQRTFDAATLTWGEILLSPIWAFAGLFEASLTWGETSVFGAIYFLAVQQNKLSPMLCAAVVSVYSAFVVLPWFVFFADSRLGSASAFEIGIQVLVQGVIRGGVCFVALNVAIAGIGSQKTSMLYALLPALGLVSSISIADDPASWVDWVAVAMISSGVLAGILLADKDRPPAPTESTAPTRA